MQYIAKIVTAELILIGNPSHSTNWHIVPLVSSGKDPRRPLFFINIKQEMGDMQTQQPGRRRQGTNTALIISYKRWETFRHSSQVGGDKGTNTALIISYKR